MTALIISFPFRHMIIGWLRQHQLNGQPVHLHGPQKKPAPNHGRLLRNKEKHRVIVHVNVGARIN